MRDAHSQSGVALAAAWNVKRDLTIFPAASSSYGIIIEYDSGVDALGGCVLVLSSVQGMFQYKYSWSYLIFKFYLLNNPNLNFQFHCLILVYVWCGARFPPSLSQTRAFVATVVVSGLLITTDILLSTKTTSFAKQMKVFS